MANITLQRPRSFRHAGSRCLGFRRRSRIPPAKTPSARCASTAASPAWRTSLWTASRTPDTANNTTLHFEPNMDSIAEMRVLTSNYQAEYGRNSSGTISIVTKSGSQQFHGSAWVNKRHEMFNAKSFFQNHNGQPKSVYRFFVWGYSIGGPVYIPKLFNTDKKKLFFFFSQEYTRQKPATQSGYANVPTVAQRAGDFAGLHGCQRRALCPHRPHHRKSDPGITTSPGLASLNPAAAKNGQAILNALPLPNICGHQGVESDWLHPGRPVRQPAILAQLLLAVQRDLTRAATTHFAWTTT